MLAAQAKERQKIYCGNQYDKKKWTQAEFCTSPKKQNQAKKANAFKPSKYLIGDSLKQGFNNETLSGGREIRPTGGVHFCTC